MLLFQTMYSLRSELDEDAEAGWVRARFKYASIVVKVVLDTKNDMIMICSVLFMCWNKHNHHSISACNFWIWIQKLVWLLDFVVDTIRSTICLQTSLPQILMSTHDYMLTLPVNTVGPLIIESLWTKNRVSTGALGALDDPFVVQTKIWKSSWVPVDNAYHL